MRHALTMACNSQRSITVEIPENRKFNLQLSFLINLLTTKSEEASLQKKKNMSFTMC